MTDLPTATTQLISTHRYALATIDDIAVSVACTGCDWTGEWADEPDERIRAHSAHLSRLIADLALTIDVQPELTPVSERVERVLDQQTDAAIHRGLELPENYRFTPRAVMAVLRRYSLDFGFMADDIDGDMPTLRCGTQTYPAVGRTISLAQIAKLTI